MKLQQGLEVGVWGSYHYGNFGDDLMAELFAGQLREWGYQPVVFSRNPGVVAPSTARVMPSINAWQGRDVVMGGGAMLSSDTLAEYFLRPATRAVRREFDELVQWCRANDGKVIPISVGGDGTGEAQIRGSRRQLFAGPWATNGTVRLRADQVLMSRAFDKRYAYYPDVLFATARLMKIPRRMPSAPARCFRVGINLHRKRAVVVVDALRARFGSALDLVPITTHSSVFEHPYEWGSGEGHALAYETMVPFVQGLGGLDLLVSDKLHVGLVAATLGTPFLSYQGKAKTQSKTVSSSFLSRV